MTSSPGYPQSYGKAKSAVKTAKRLLIKAKTAGQDPYLALLDHRNTPSQGLESSPTQQLLSHRTKTLLPTKASLLRPKVVWVSHDLKNKQQCQSTYNNRSARDLGILNMDDCVRIQPLPPNTVWRLGRVLKPVDGRSYEVQLQSRSVIRRNRRHLRRGVTWSDLQWPYWYGDQHPQSATGCGIWTFKDCSCSSQCHSRTHTQRHW